jgi:peptidylprolyl isomerase
MPAKSGDSVRVHYKGSLEDGTVFDSSYDTDPFEFTLGAGMVIPGFDQAVIGMDAGAVKTVSIPPDEAYGEYLDDHTIEVDRAQVPDSITPEVGLGLELHSNDGQTIDVVISRIDGDNITLDANHPLAGKTLTFEISLLEIVQR